MNRADAASRRRSAPGADSGSISPSSLSVSIKRSCSTRYRSARHSDTDAAIDWAASTLLPPATRPIGCSRHQHAVTSSTEDMHPFMSTPQHSLSSRCAILLRLRQQCQTPSGPEQMHHRHIVVVQINESLRCSTNECPVPACLKHFIIDAQRRFYVTNSEDPFSEFPAHSDGTNSGSRRYITSLKQSNVPRACATLFSRSIPPCGPVCIEPVF